MALSKIDVANMLTGIAPVANGGTASTTLVAAGLGKRPLSKPIIINGNMAVAQRGTSFAAIGDGVYSLDRYEASKNNDGAVTITQEALTSGNAYTDGFRTALKVDVTTADGTLAGTQRFLVQQIVEAQNLQSLKFGTANAEKLTLAFWVKATKTGTHIVRMFQYDDDRSVSIAYTVNTTNTWEKKVMNFPADTTGVIDNDNGPGIQIAWGVGAGASFQSGTLATAWAGNTSANDFVGQVNGLDNTSNNFHLTGIQLEVGEFSSTTLPPFQHESFGDNLLRCQRYFRSYGGGHATEQVAVGYTTGAQGETFIDYSSPVMRSTPTMSLGTINTWKIYSNGSGYVCSGNPGASDATPRNMKFLTDHASGATAGQGGMLQANGTTDARLTLSSEL